MVTYYFYCPNCGKEDIVNKIPKGVRGNIRDGYGMPIYHYECSNCHNLDAGFMMEREKDEGERRYYQSVIKMYQGIRGFSK